MSVSVGEEPTDGVYDVVEGLECGGGRVPGAWNENEFGAGYC
jgi:hypothetical protein